MSDQLNKDARRAGRWTLAFKLMRRELRSGFRGFYIFLTCLVLGVAAIAAVQSLSRGMMDSLIYDGRYILGGDIALRKIYQPATKDQYKFLQKLGVVTVVTDTRAMARRADDASATMVELKGVDPYYPLYGELIFTDGEGKKIDVPTQDLLLPPVDSSDVYKELDLWGALVEKDLLVRLKLEVGDVIKIGNMQYRIRGIITKEPDRISAARYTLAPRVMISSYSFDKTGLTLSGNQVYYDYRLFLPHMREPALLEQAQKQIEEKLGKDSGWRGRNYYNASPQIKRSIDQLTQFLTLIGLTTLLIGGVGISNAVRAFLGGKLASIATLKSLGAPQRLVMRVYLLQIFALATLGIVIGLALGSGLSQVAGAMVTERLSLSNKVGFYPDALGLAALFGYLTVLCFALWPLGRAVEVSPRDLFRDLIAPALKRPHLNVILMVAIAAQALALLAIISASDQRLAVWFVAGTLIAFAVFQSYAFVLKGFLKRLRGLSKPALRMAVANLHRPGNVSSAVILSLGLGLTVLSAIALVEHNLSRLLREDIAADAPSFFFLDVEPAQKENFFNILGQTEGVRNIQITPSYRGRIALVNGVPAEKALKDKSEEWVIRSDRGFTYAAKQPGYSRVIEGAWWAEDFNSKAAGKMPQISIADDVARAFDIGVGDKLTISVMGVDIEAEVANVREINWASFTMNFAVTFAPGALDDAPVNFLATAIVPEDMEEKVQGELAAKIPNVTSVRVREALAAAEKLVGGVLQAVRLSAGVTLIAGLLVLAGGISAARTRHFYDAVILKVLGATQKRILGTFLLEYALLGFVTVFIAGLLGTAASYAVINGIMELPWEFSIASLASVVVASLIITMAAGFAGTYSALKRKPAPYLRNQ